MRPDIRSARADDLDLITKLDQICFGSTAWGPSAWADEFERLGVDRLILVADQEAVVGFVVLLVPPVAGDPVDLLRIAVDPAERRTGIGGQLMTAALAAVPGRTVLLEVADGNECARRLYAGVGFTELSRRRRYYRRGEDAVIMQWQRTEG